MPHRNTQKKTPTPSYGRKVWYAQDPDTGKFHHYVDKSKIGKGAPPPTLSRRVYDTIARALGRKTRNRNGMRSSALGGKRKRKNTKRKTQKKHRVRST